MAKQKTPAAQEPELQAVPLDATLPPCGLFRPFPLKDFDSTPQPWLWPGRIPLGHLTLLVGDPGVGKSLLSLELAARVSRGWSDPDLANASAPPQHGDADSVGPSPASVLLLTAEDNLRATIRPRLEAAGADCSRIFAIPMLVPIRELISRENGIQWTFDLRFNANRILSFVRQAPGCRLLVVDSIQNFLGDNSLQARRGLAGVLLSLAAVARDCGLAVVLITHFRKKPGRAVHASLGSLAYVATARAVWAVTKDPSNADRRFFLPVKNNLAPDAPPLAFTIRSEPPACAPTICWSREPVSEHPGLELSLSRPCGRPNDQRQQAAAWLRQRLAGAPCVVRELREEADMHGFSRNTISRAFRDVGGKAIKSGIADGPWTWQLPVEETQN